MYMKEYYLNEKFFINSDYIYKKIYDQIYLVENFITEEEQKTLLEFLYSLNENKWQELYLNNLKNNALKKFGTDDIFLLEKENKISINMEWYDKSVSIGEKYSNMSNSFLNRIFTFFNEKDFNIKYFETVQRHKPKDFMSKHVDSEHDSNLIFAGVLYINDDYFGGELYFEKFDITLKPKARSLVLFSTGKDYIHEIKTVLDGPTRYAMPCFIWKNNSEIKVV